MKAIKTALTVAVISLFLTGAAYAAESKIGVFNFQKVLAESVKGKAANEEINRQGGKMKGELDIKKKEIEELTKKLERESLVMSREQREEKEREIRIRINDLKTLQKRFSNNMNQLQKTIGSRIQKELFEVIAEVGKADKYMMILEKNQGGVWYHTDTIDLTDRFIRLYDEKSKAAQ